MKNYLSDHKMDVPLLNNFSQFSQENLAHKDLFPQSASGEQLDEDNQKIEELIDMAKGFFFRFVQIEDVFEQQDYDHSRELSKILRKLSTSFN